MIFRVKTGLIPAFTKCDAIIKIGVIFKGVALIRISSGVMPGIHHLEITMLFHDLSALLTYKRAQDRSGVFVVIVRCVNVTDIMQ